MSFESWYHEQCLLEGKTEAEAEAAERDMKKWFGEAGIPEEPEDAMEARIQRDIAAIRRLFAENGLTKEN